MIVTVSENGQLVIPAEIRRILGITPGTRLDIVPDSGGFRALVSDTRKSRSAAECIGIAGYSGQTVSIEQMDAARYARK